MLCVSLDTKPLIPQSVFVFLSELQSMVSRKILLGGGGQNHEDDTVLALIGASEKRCPHTGGARYWRFTVLLATDRIQNILYLFKLCSALIEVE